MKIYAIMHFSCGILSFIFLKPEDLWNEKPRGKHRFKQLKLYSKYQIFILPVNIKFRLE